MSKQSNASQNAAGKGGLILRDDFCPPEVRDPFETCQWERRTASITDANGAIVFEQADCEIPAAWSQLATNIVASKYFYGAIESPSREHSVRQMIQRVTRTIADWGRADGYFDNDEDCQRFYRNLSWLCLHQYGSFHSPVWFNAGLFQQYGVQGDQPNWRWDPKTDAAISVANPYEYPQCSACFIQSVADDMRDIMRLAASEALLFKFGSGTGTDLSTLRSHREALAGGGKPSGPLSFMRVYDQIAGVVKSGGKTRRAAKMQSLQVWHPDILEFVECKFKEEQKARILIDKGGYPADFNGEAYSSILFQNANLSVRVSDEFMQAARSDGLWTTHWVTDPQRSGPQYSARALLQRMAECAWACGDPGIQYDSTINRWNTCPNSGRINASNPCSEYMFLDDTACNLASINLMKFRTADGQFDSERFVAACRLFFIAQEILVDRSSYPSPQIAANSHRFRPLGLGYTNLGGLLMSLGIPYDSVQSRGWCGTVTALLTGAAYRTSAELAAVRGAFEAFETNRDAMLQVIDRHRDAVHKIDGAAPEFLRAAAQELWDDVLRMGRQFGFRNAQATVLAPTGTISFMMDCDTTGIEPELALVKYKHLAGGGVITIVNRVVPVALKSLGYEQAACDRIAQHILESGSVEGAIELRSEHLPVFDCALRTGAAQRSISWQAHVAMMAAAQPLISGAISKTVNMPSHVSADDIRAAYDWGWELGLKSLAIYRDGSKSSQPLQTRDSDGARLGTRPQRQRLSDTRHSITHKFNIAGHEGYLTVGLYENGQPGELFITMAKEGSTIGGLMDSFGTAISLALQYGVPLEVLVQKFSHARFEPMGPTTDPEIPLAKSVVDYIFRWLGKRFLSGDTADAKSTAANSRVESTRQIPAVSSDEAPSCFQCGAITVRSGNCYLCLHCGSSMGCS